MPLSNLTIDDMEKGKFYRLIPDFNTIAGCGAVPGFRSDTNIYIQVTDFNHDPGYEGGGRLEYNVFRNGMESGDKVGGCSGCIRSVHLEFLEPAKSAASVKMESVVIAPAKREQIMAAISQPQHTAKIFTDWGFDEVFEKGTAVSLLFYGVPGTGKTLTAQAIADELGMELKILNTADIESSEPGGAERAIREFFKEAQKRYDAHQKTPSKKAQILLFDECDSLLTDRNAIGVIMAAQVNSLLTELEKFKGVVIFTTNRLGKLDPALERRITAKIEFEFPDEEARVKIWTRMIPSKAPLNKDVDLAELAQFPMVGGNIKNVVLNAARRAAYEKSNDIKRSHFLGAIEEEIKGLQGFVAAFEENSHNPRQVDRGYDRSEGGANEISKARGADKVQTIEKTTAKTRTRGRGGVK